MADDAGEPEAGPPRPDAAEAAAAAAAEAAEEDGPDVGPQPPKAKRRRVLEHEAAFLSELPLADMYERSYMHRDVVTQVAVARATDFVVTASADGHIKFWKKQATGIEFAKHFKAHVGPVTGLAVSEDGALCASISTDRTAKVFDVATFDMIAMLRLPYVPGAVEWVFARGDPAARLAISEAGAPAIHVYDARGGGAAPLGSVALHAAPVTAMRYNAARRVVVSADARGVLEYWSPETFAFPSGAVDFEMKVETDLYALAVAKAPARSLEVSPDGARFAAVCADAKVRVFRFATGKLSRTYDESPAAAAELQRAGAPALRLDPLDFGRRVAAEKALAADPEAPPPNAVFDASGNFLLYPTLLGIKVVNLVTNRLVKVVGRVEASERFLRLALAQCGGARRLKALPSGGEPPRGAGADPTLVACAHGKPRLYLFSRREPEDPGESGDPARGRDVFNEKPAAEAALAAAVAGGAPGAAADLPRAAVIHTTKGDIWVKLFPDECPRTVENFTTHGRNGYYDGVLFHRVIKGFMLQTGDPAGDGTGGESIWGGEFEDEISRGLKHDRPFTLSMANAGPGTNGSQFYITTVPTPWLDGKHTVFGRVVKGMDVALAIEKARVDKGDRPVEDVRVVNVEPRAALE
jgi:peptidylprolyl isomerase domain and WD repeat-containing protein 1